MDEELDRIRTRLDAVDRRIVDDLADRQRLVEQAATLKHEHDRQPRDPQREDQMLAALRERAAQGGVDQRLVDRLFREILDSSVRQQAERRRAGATLPPLTVAYQGSAGAYSEIAATRHFEAVAQEVVCLGHPSFREALTAVRDGLADRAMLPVENTTAGSINEAYDLLASMDLAAVGEEVLRVEHCLVTLAPARLSDIRRILSHPQALAQCGRFLSQLPGCHAEAFTDTAMAVERVLADGDASQAAIASARAAELHGLTIAARDVADHSENYTRFLVIAREHVMPAPGLPAKTSLMLVTPHQDGALVRCLNVLATRGLNLTKLESRPRPRNPFEYLFYIDFEGSRADAAVDAALQELAHCASSLKVLGSYVAALESVAKRPERTAGTTGLDAALRPARRPRLQLADRVESQPVAGEKAPTATVTPPRKRADELARRREDQPDTVVRVGTAEFGAGSPVIIGGPCAVESRTQIFAAAHAVRAAGAHMLRGGCFKPRSSTYSFQGLGYEGLELLVEAGQRAGLPVITEVMRPREVERVAAQADMLQIGTRNMQNFDLLRAVGRTQTPVLLKRGMMSSIEEWLAAAEYVLAEGNQQVVLCERGIRTFETATRGTLDLTVIPVVRERTHLPVIVDPSHAAGERRWVPALARAAIAAGAHGVIVETHPDPDHALCDGAQSLTLDGFRDLARSLRGGSTVGVAV